MNPPTNGHSGHDPPGAGSPAGRAGLEQTSLRAAVAWLAVRRRDTPARQLAAEIGIGKSSVDKVLREGVAPKKNAPKLIRWFLRDRHARQGTLQEPGAMAALVLELLAHLSARRRPAALRRLLALLEEVHREARAPRPPWLDTLRQVLTEEEGDRPRRTPPDRAR